MSNAETGLGRFVRDLRQRKVFRAAAAYAVSAWLVVEVADVVFPLLGLPDWALRSVALVAIAGLPFAVLFAWLFDLTSSGVVRTTSENLKPLGSIDRRVDFIIIAALAVAVAVLVFKPDPEPSLKSIAVLPFQDFSGDSEYLADGLAEGLLNSLVSVEGLRVAARTSSFAFKGLNEDIRTIGQHLNVDTVLEGSVQRAGERVRITAQLINVSDGFHLWSQSFERRLDNIFAIQDDIARAIVDALKVRLGAAETERMTQHASTNFAAYDLYLLGRHHWHQRTPESLRRAVELFQQATETDPGLARAYSGLADSYLLLRDYGDLSTESAQAQAEAAIARALELDPNLAEAYASLGLARLMRKDFVAAELAFRNAIELDPSYSMAHMWLGLVLDQVQGPAAALEEYTAAHSSDPLHPVVNANLAAALGKMGRYPEAQSSLERALGANPEAPSLRLSLAWLASVYGRYDEAVGWLLPALTDRAETDQVKAIFSNVLVSLGDLERATEILSRSDPVTESNALFNVRAYLMLKQGDATRLLSTLDTREVGMNGNPGDTMQPSLMDMWRGLAQLLIGNFDRAAQSIDAFMATPVAGKIDSPERLRLLGLAAYAYRQLGDQANAELQLKRSEAEARRAVSQGWASPDFQAALAGHYAMLGDRDRALLAIDRAVSLGWRDLWTIENDPRFLSIRSDEALAQTRARLQNDLSSMRDRADQLISTRLAMRAN